MFGVAHALDARDHEADSADIERPLDQHLVIGRHTDDRATGRALQRMDLRNAVHKGTGPVLHIDDDTVIAGLADNLRCHG